MSSTQGRAVIAEWIAEWFRQHGRVLTPADVLQSDVDYIEAGFLDSIMMIEFIMDIETQFRVRLTAPIMQDPRFTTLQGLTDILQQASL